LKRTPGNSSMMYFLIEHIEKPKPVGRWYLE